MPPAEELARPIMRNTYTLSVPGPVAGTIPAVGYPIAINGRELLDIRLPGQFLHALPPVARDLSAQRLIIQEAQDGSLHSPASLPAATLESCPFTQSQNGGVTIAFL